MRFLSGAAGVSLSLLLAGPVLGQGWEYFRDVSVKGKVSGDTLAEIVLTPDITSKCRPGMADIGLFGPDGREVPFIIRERKSAELSRVFSGDFVVNRESDGKKSVWTVDLGETRVFDRIESAITANSYFKPVTIDVSRDMKGWRRAKISALLFAGDGRIKGVYNVIKLASPATARYIRITGDDTTGPVLEPSGFNAVASDNLSGLRWKRVVQAVRDKTVRRKASVYRLRLRPNEYFDRVMIESAENRYVATAGVFEKTAFNDPRVVAQRESPPPGIYRAEAFFSADEQPDFDVLWLGGGQICSARAGNSSIQVKLDEIGLVQAGTGEIWLEIRTQNQEPLAGLSVSVSGLSPSLLFAATEARLTLKYGNKVVESRTRPENMVKALADEGGAVLGVKMGREKRY